MSDVIWSNTVDGNTWTCQVQRTGDYSGELSVARVEDGTVILCEMVSLAYGATFGPDMDDVWAWETRCIEVIDTLAEDAKRDLCACSEPGWSHPTSLHEH